jgi:lysyl endopeptidase
MMLHVRLTALLSKLLPCLGLGASVLCSSGSQAQFFDVAVTSITNVPPLVCDTGLIVPRITIKNNSSEVVNSMTLLYGVPAMIPSIDTWAGSLQPGQTVIYFLPPIVIPTGEHLLTVRSSSPNGQTDQVPENDAWSIPVVVSEPAEVVTMRLQLDNFGSDVTWNLVSDQGTELFSGGPYANVNGGQLVEESFCLTNGCYTFTITDLFGDGICCGSGNGNFTLSTSGGQVVAESDGQFGKQDVQQFCFTNVYIVEQLHSGSMEVFPNPSGGPVSIRLEGIRSAVTLQVLDGLGRKVKEMILPAGIPSVQIDLSGLKSGIYSISADHAEGRVVRRVVLQQ